MDYEKKFIDKLKKIYDGDVTYSRLERKGWPDFCVVANNNIYLYEVKGRANASQPSRSMFEVEQWEFLKENDCAQIAFYGSNKQWEIFILEGDNFVLVELL